MSEVKIGLTKSDVINLAETLRPPDRTPGTLDWARAKFAYYLGLVEKALEKEYFAVNKMRVADEGYNKYVQAMQELADRYAKRDEQGRAIPGSLENPEKYYEKKKELDDKFEADIKAEEERRKKIVDEFQNEVEITISHKLQIKNYVKELYKIKRPQMELLMPFFDGSIEDLDFSSIEKDEDDVKNLSEQIEKCKKEIARLEKDNRDLADELKQEKEKGKKKE